MSKLRAFFKRHILLVGLAAVVVPLFSIIGLQYLSLRKLEQTSIVAGGVGMKNFLSGVSGEIKMFYKLGAEAALAVSPHAVKGDRLYGPDNHFPVCNVDGARRVFLTAFDESGAPQTVFFDARDTSVRVEDVSPREARAVQYVTTPLGLLAKDKSPYPQAWVFMEDHDMDNIILFRAIVEDAKVVGAAGMILDEAYFRDTVMPAKVRDAVAKYFPEGTDSNVIVTAYGSKDEVLFTTQDAKGQHDEIKTNLPNFYYYKVGIRSRHMTPEQWA
ncbi:MAG TPA: hypothetical protein VM936_11830, partial [Pyrinomonadaceae bacterium]|nr:hypothetical protein [Pyrinomonadaceae bacterium]